MTTLALLLFGLSGPLVQNEDGDKEQWKKDEAKVAPTEFTLQKEVPELRKQVEHDAVVIKDVLKKIQDKVGSSPEKILQTVEGLGKQYEQAAKSAKSQGEREDLEAALRILRGRQMRDAIRQMPDSRFEGKMSQFALNIQSGALKAQAADVGDTSADNLSQAYDGGKRGLGLGSLSPGPNYLQGRFRTAADLEDQVGDVTPQAEHSMTVIEQVQALGGELGANKDQIRSAEQRIRELRTREAELKRQSGKPAAGNPESLEGEIRELKSKESGLKMSWLTLQAGMDRLTEENKRASAAFDKIAAEIKADSYAFYDNHKADCYIIGNVETLPDGSTRFSYGYRPKDALNEEVKRTYDAWQQEKVKQGQVNAEMLQVQQKITQAEIGLREAKRRQELEQAINKLKIESKGLNDLKTRRSEILSLYEQLMASLRSTAARIRGWLQHATETDRRLNE